jgi:xanthine dehydrogenase accessory factor
MEEDGATFVHVHNPPLRMIVVGAVHIAQALLPMARMAGYDVSLSTRAPPSRRRRGFPARR